MFSTTPVVAALASVSVLVAIGMVCRHRSILSGEADSSLMKIVVNVMLPALIFSSILGKSCLLEPSQAVMLIGCGCVLTLVCMLIAYQVGRLIFRHQRDGGTKARTFGVTASMPNAAYVGIPVAIGLWGPQSAELAVLTVYNVGLDIALWSVGVLILSGSFNRDWCAKLLNGPSVAVTAALLCNFTGLHHDIPLAIIHPIEMLGKGAIPFGVLLCGAVIYDLLFRESGFFRSGLRVVFAAIGVRLLILPIPFLAVAIFLPGLSDEARRMLCLLAALPAPFFTILLARHFGGDPMTALRVSISTFAIGMVCIGIWLNFGLSMLEHHRPKRVTRELSPVPPETTLIVCSPWEGMIVQAKNRR
ncbi:MAG: hypothetical protein RL095_420 [Verrucomicrobiota bacterium]|jgi:predicted permease